MIENFIAQDLLFLSLFNEIHSFPISNVFKVFKPIKCQLWGPKYACRLPSEQRHDQILTIWLVEQSGVVF